jgi:hypothetical protein
MDIKVYNRNPADLVVVERCQGSDSNVVEDAVPAPSAAVCVVPGRPAGQGQATPRILV